MKILVMGAGAVGGYFGARLYSAGNEVFLVARGKHLKAIRKKGLCVKSIKGDLHIPIQASDEPSEFGIVDMILLTVKSQDTGHALSLIKQNVGLDTFILTLQNGVENEEKISQAYGGERTLGGAAYIGVRLDSPGCIIHSALGRVAIGSPFTEGPSEERIREIVRVFRDAGIPAKVSEDIMKTKWAKLVWNAAFNPVSVLTGLTTHSITESPELRELLTGIMKEVIAVAVADGYELNEKEMLEKTFCLTEGVSDVKTSMLQDFERGRPLEIDALNGVVVRKGKENGVPVPLNTAVVGLIMARVRSQKSL